MVHAQNMGQYFTTNTQHRWFLTCKNQVNVPRAPTPQLEALSLEKLKNVFVDPKVPEKQHEKELRNNIKLLAQVEKNAQRAQAWVEKWIATRVGKVWTCFVCICNAWVRVAYVHARVCVCELQYESTLFVYYSVRAHCL